LNGGDPILYRVRHVAPMAIYARLAAVRAYDEWVNIPWTDLPDPPLERLHALRIACKRLRYALEFFREVLGPDTKALIKEIVTMQDHLGDLQDAVVARRLLREYLQRGAWGSSVASGVAGEPLPEVPLDAVGVEAYLAAKQAELEHLLETFPSAWQRITATEFSQMVADAVVVL
jgi:CHAD domain-containing protein